MGNICSNFSFDKQSTYSEKIVKACRLGRLYKMNDEDIDVYAITKSSDFEYECEILLPVFEKQLRGKNIVATLRSNSIKYIIIENVYVKVKGFKNCETEMESLSRYAVDLLRVDVGLEL